MKKNYISFLDYRYTINFKYIEKHLSNLTLKNDII